MEMVGWEKANSNFLKAKTSHKENCPRVEWAASRGCWPPFLGGLSAKTVGTPVGPDAAGIIDLHGYLVPSYSEMLDSWI